MSASSSTIKLPKARKAFCFFSRLELTELTGLKAKNIRELLTGIRKVPGSVLYQHTHQFLQQHQYLVPEPSNDFAYWVGEILGLNFLGEELASVTINEFKTIREIREAFIYVLEQYLKLKERPRYAPPGEEFYFLKSVSFIFPTPYRANDLAEFVDGLNRVTIDSLYFHMFESKLRLERGGNDFSFWLETSLLEGELAGKIAKLDPYTHTMDSLRRTIIRLVEKRIAELKKIQRAYKTRSIFKNYRPQ